jgi:hypothetical protein
MQSQSAVSTPDEAPVLRHVRLALGDQLEPPAGGALPVKGGMKGHRDRFDEAGQEPTPKAGEREVYVLARADGAEVEMPVFPAGPNEAGAAAVVFTNRELATLYLQVARTDRYETRSVTPRQLTRWVMELEGHDVRFLLVDPNRSDQRRGAEPKARLALSGLRDRSGENLYQEIHSLATT